MLHRNILHPLLERLVVDGLSINAVDPASNRKLERYFVDPVSVFLKDSFDRPEERLSRASSELLEEWCFHWLLFAL